MHPGEAKRRYDGIELVLTALAVISSITAVKTHIHKTIKHHRGCNTTSCDHRIDRLWARKHRPLEETIASWYGPADSGGNLACGGGALTSSTLGVANKTLPCGTPVRVCLDRCVDVKVVDRGPYVEGRSYDLTEATARSIGFLDRGVGPIWVAVL